MVRPPRHLGRRIRSLAPNRSSESRTPSSEFVFSWWEVHALGSRRWVPLARSEFRTVVRSKALWALALLVPLWAYAPQYDVWTVAGPDMTLAFVQYAMAGAVPLAVLLLTYNAVVGERDSGTLKFTLALPLTRAEILAAKVVGRWAGVCVPLSVPFLVLVAAGVYHYGLVSPLSFVGVALATLVYLLVLVALGVAASAATARPVRAVAGAFGGIYLVGVLAWIPIVRFGYPLVTGTTVNPVDPPPDGLLFLLPRLGPAGAYQLLTNWILGIGNSAAGAGAVAGDVVPGSRTTAFVVDTTFTGSAPVYLHEVGGLVVLLAWLVGALAVAHVAFTRGDLV